MYSKEREEDKGISFGVGGGEWGGPCEEVLSRNEVAAFGI